ncbi:MAG: putative toxin-antitoxin system toxin component, PIN family [Hadesarchaea archaeon B3_Hades]|nr:MAG: putative toxin-antitoxin system toxin component, PIN family [Hadesarchaea archaeon B3_Hades]
MLKVVLDTNVFIAAYFNRKSASARIIDLCLENKHELIFSPRLRKEVKLILKNVRAERGFHERIQSLFMNASKVKPIQKVFMVKEDPEDNKFLECALEGEADYLITSDRHLLELGEFAQTKICKPTQFLNYNTLDN